MNGSGRSPKKLTLEHVRQRGNAGSSLPATDLNSVTVPGQHSVLLVLLIPKI